MDEVVELDTRIEAKLLDAMHRCVSLVIQELRTYKVPERIARGRPRALMRLACKLLGKLHEYLNSSLYTKEMESRLAAATKVKAFVYTGTNLTKIMAQRCIATLHTERSPAVAV